MLSLVPSDGALRLRLDEPDWVGLLSTAGLSAAGSPLAPIDGTRPGTRSCDASVRQAAALAVGPAALRVEVVTTSGDRGVLAVLGCDGQAAGAAVRVAAGVSSGVDSEEAEAAPVPGIELSGFAAQRLVAETLRLFPPDGPVLPLDPGQPREVELPQELAITLTRALQQGDEPIVRAVTEQCVWSAVPDLVQAVAEDVRGSAAVTISVAGQGTSSAHRWLQCRLGWVELGLRDGRSVSRLQTRAQIEQTLVHSLTGAFDLLLADPGR